MNKYKELRDAIDSQMSEAEFAYCGCADKNTIRALLAERDALVAKLEWYAEMAKMMQRASLHGDNQMALHVLKEMALDGGKRAREG